MMMNKKSKPVILTRIRRRFRITPLLWANSEPANGNSPYSILSAGFYRTSEHRTMNFPNELFLYELDEFEKKPRTDGSIELFSFQFFSVQSNIQLKFQRRTDASSVRLRRCHCEPGPMRWQGTIASVGLCAETAWNVQKKLTLWTKFFTEPASYEGALPLGDLKSAKISKT